MIINTYCQKFLHQIITKLRKNSLKTYLKKLNMKIKIFLSHQRDWQNFEQDNKSIVPNTLFSSQNIEEITLVYKSEHNFKQENKLLLLMINYDEKYYYFAVKIKLELYSSE